MKACRGRDSRVFVEIFSGCGNLSRHRRQAGHAVIEWDILRGLEFDLSQPGPWAVLPGWLVSGTNQAVFMGTPCETLSQARRGGPHSRMPRRSRDGAHLLGT